MKRVLGLFGAAAMATAALANDTTASTGAGGLVLEQTQDIDMVSEDLLVSAEQIRVRYVFRNRTAKDVETIVAFPMPSRDLSDEYGGDVAYPSGFQTFVEGRQIKAQLERKAMLKGRDHAALLDRLRIPLAPGAIREAVSVMDRLSPAQKARLQQLGLAGEEEYDDDGRGMKRHLIPLWTVNDTYWWKQRFPAGHNLRVEHGYVPGVGGSVDTPIAIAEYRRSPEAKETIARYCMDRQFIAAVDRLSSKDPMRGHGMPDQRIDYILTTGANWRSPIGDFRLVVDKGRPGNLVSFCGEGVRKIGPTQYEVRHKNWRPARDLHVLIIQPQR
jgi:hypothetical protein